MCRLCANLSIATWHLFQLTDVICAAIVHTSEGGGGKFQGPGSFSRGLLIDLMLQAFEVSIDKYIFNSMNIFYFRHVHNDCVPNFVSFGSGSYFDFFPSLYSNRSTRTSLMKVPKIVPIMGKVVGNLLETCCVSPGFTQTSVNNLICQITLFNRFRQRAIKNMCAVAKKVNNGRSSLAQFSSIR